MLFEKLAFAPSAQFPHESSSTASGLETRSALHHDGVIGDQRGIINPHCSGIVVRFGDSIGLTLGHGPLVTLLILTGDVASTSSGSTQ